MWDGGGAGNRAFQKLLHPTIRKERKGQQRRGRGIFPGRGWTGLSHDGYQGSLGRAVPGSEPNLGCEGQRRCRREPWPPSPPSEVAWVSQSQTANPPGNKQPWSRFLFKFPGVAWPTGSRDQGRSEGKSRWLPQPTSQQSPGLRPLLSLATSLAVALGAGLALLRELGQYLLTD